MLVLDDHTKLSFPSCYFTSSKGAPISQWGPKNIFLWEPLAIFYDTSTMSQKFSIQVPVYPDGSDTFTRYLLWDAMIYPSCTNTGSQWSLNNWWCRYV